MSGRSLMDVTLYTGRGCHLCDEARQAMSRVQARVPFEWDEVQIDGNPDLEALWRQELPVVCVDGRKLFKYRVDEQKLEQAVRSRT